LAYGQDELEKDSSSSFPIFDGEETSGMLLMTILEGVDVWETIELAMRNSDRCCGGLAG
jgi:hypothetical protein